MIGGPRVVSTSVAIVTLVTAAWVFLWVGLAPADMLPGDLTVRWPRGVFGACLLTTLPIGVAISRVRRRLEEQDEDSNESAAQNNEVEAHQREAHGTPDSRWRARLHFLYMADMGLGIASMSYWLGVIEDSTLLLVVSAVFAASTLLCLIIAVNPPALASSNT